MTEEALEQFYQESLEERLIQTIAKELHLSLEEATVIIRVGWQA